MAGNESDHIPDFCDMCGRELDRFATDYVVNIEVRSGTARGDIGAGLDQEDIRREIEELIARTDRMTEPELMDGVYRRMRFIICPPCQKIYIRNPIPRNFKQD